MAQKISKNFSSIGENIKKIRQAKKISQADFAKLFNLARPSVGAYEEGRSEPKIETIIQIAEYFKISIDVLLTRQLTVSEIYSFDQLNKKLDKVHQNKSSRSKTAKDVALVRIAHYLEYIINIDKKDFVNSLEQTAIPFSSTGTWRVFEMNGSEMEYQHHGLHHQDLITCSKVEWDSVKAGDIYIIVQKGGILTRRLKSIHSDMLILSADDPSFEDISFYKDDILECWKAQGVFTTRLQAPSRLEERILKIEEELKKLKN